LLITSLIIVIVDLGYHGTALAIRFKLDFKF